MKLLMVFGSKSDANIYEPLKERLKADGHEIDFRMISVHRSPELLDRELASIKVDAVVAGAGLAAHLPGVLASKLLVPVIGIPCSAAIGGVDALFAMMQMPFGIPVLCTSVDNTNAAANFLQRWESMDLQYSSDVFTIVMDKKFRKLPHSVALLERARKIAEKNKFDLSLVERPVEGVVNICPLEINLENPEEPLPFAYPEKKAKEVRIYVPSLSLEAYRDPVSAIAVVKRIQSVDGGVWTGINNIANAMLAALQLANASGSYSAFLINAKKGYVHA